MKIKWLKKRGGGDTLVFFGGFACAETLLDGMRLPNCDVCLVYDYGDFGGGLDFSQYKNVYVCAWSFGVKAADVFTRNMENVRMRVAVCGTNAPVGGRAGIPRAVFEKTVAEFETSAGKFFRRVCGAGGVPEGMSSAGGAALAAQLARFEKFFAQNPGPLCRWDYAFACAGDTIFPPRAVKAAFGNVSVWEGLHLNRSLLEYALNVPFSSGRVCAAFERRAAVYDKSSVAQRNVGLYLRERLCEMFAGRTFEEAFEFGCGTGFFSAQIMRHLSCKRYFVNDSSLRLCAAAAKRLGAEFTAGQIESVAVPCSPDLILSASCLQWVKNRAAVYKKLFAAARPGAVAALGSFGKKNFAELSELGIAPLEYDTLEKFAGEVSAAGFEILYSAEEKFSFLLPAPRDVLLHIKNTGVNGASASFWTPQKFARFAAEYSRRFSDFGGVRLTYNPIYVIARKPQ